MSQFVFEDEVTQATAPPAGRFVFEDGPTGLGIGESFARGFMGSIPALIAQALAKRGIVAQAGEIPPTEALPPPAEIAAAARRFEEDLATQGEPTFGESVARGLGTVIPDLPTYVGGGYGAVKLAKPLLSKVPPLLAKAAGKIVGGIGAFEAPAAIREAAIQTGEGEVVPERFAKELGIGGATGGAVGAASLIPNPLLRVPAEVVAMVGAESYLRQGRLPTFKELLEGGVTIAALQAAFRLAGLAFPSGERAGGPVRGTESPDFKGAMEATPPIVRPIPGIVREAAGVKPTLRTPEAAIIAPEPTAAPPVAVQPGEATIAPVQPRTEQVPAAAPTPSPIGVGDPVEYRPKLSDRPITGAVTHVNPDGTVNIRARAGGVIRKVPAEKVTPLLTPDEVGLDSTRVGKRVALGPDDKAILGEMHQTIRDVGGEVGQKIFLEGGEVGRGGDVTVKGFKTGKPSWMEIPDRPGEYYKYPEVVTVLESLRQGKWPKTAKQARIAEQLLQETRFDAEEEKGRLASWERQALESETAPTEQPRRDQAIQDSFFAEVDRLAAEETGAFQRESVGSPMLVEGPQGTRAVTGMDPRLMKVLGGNLYSGDLGVVAVKEMLQNATDSLRALPDPGRGAIRVTVDTTKRTIEVADTGSGMTPEVATKELVDIGGSAKAEGAAGGFGIAKVAIFANADEINVRTVAADPKTGRRIETTLQGSGSDWSDPTRGLTVQNRTVPVGTQTGTTIQIRLGLDVPMSVWSSREFLQDFIEVHRLPGSFGFSVDGQTVQPEKGLSPVSMIGTIPFAGGTMDIYGSKASMRSSAVNYQVLNNGLPQFRGSMYTGHDLPLPQRVVVDVRAVSGPEAADYPFRPDRQGLREHAQEKLYSYLLENLVGDAAKAEKEIYAKALREAVPIGTTGIGLVDATGVMSKADLTRLAKEPHLAELTIQIRAAFDALQDGLPDLKKADFGGIGLSGRFLATNVSGEAIHGPGARNIILVNPYNIAAEVEHAIRQGVIKRADAYEAFGDRLVATLIHEISHQDSRSHGEEFAGQLTRNYAKLSRLAVVTADQFASSVGPKDLFGRRMEIYDSSIKALKWLEKQWAGAEDILSKISTSLAESPGGRRAAGTPQPGPSGRPESEGLVSGRPEVTPRRLESRPTVLPRPTRVQEGPGPSATPVPEGQPTVISKEPTGTTLGSLGGAFQEAAGYLPESVRNLPAAYRAQVQKGIDYITAKMPKALREARGLGQEYVDVVHDRGATLANYIERAVELSGKLQEGLTPAEQARVDQVLRGGITVNPAIERLVNPVRALIDELQAKLVKYGYLTPEDVQMFQERFRSHPEYLRRLYETKLVPPDQPILAGEMIGPVGRGVKSEALMMRGDIQRVKLPLMGGEPLVGKDRADFLAPWLKKGYRLLQVEGDTATIFRDIPEPIRKAMGEIRTKPGFVAAKTAAEQARIVANHEFLAKIAENPEWAKPGLTDVELASGEWTRLAGDKKKWGPLGDMFVRKEVALEVQNSIRIRQDWEKVIGRLVGMWKYGKVIVNPAAMGRNVISSAILADFGGLHPWMVDEWAKGAKDFAEQGGLYSEAKQLGLFRSTYTANEILGLADGLARSTQPNAMLRVLDGMHEIVEATGKKTGIRPAALYGTIENFYRYNLYRYGREGLGLTPVEARRYALKYAIDYEVVSPAVAALRGTGGGWAAPLFALGGSPFATFSAKAIPLTLETAALHPLRVGKYLALIYGVSKVAGAQIGQVEEETAAQREIGSLNPMRYALLPFRDKDGRAQYYDLGYTLPFGDLIEALDAAMGGQGRRANVAFLPVVSHPTFAVAEAILNKSGFTGKELSEPSDTALQSVMKRVNHIYSSWMPSFAPPAPGLEKGGYAYEDLRRAFTTPPETDFLGRTRSPGAALLANVAGLRARGVTTPELANFRARQYDEMFKALDKDLIMVATRYRNNKPEADRRIAELKQRYIEIAKEAKDLFGLIPTKPSPPTSLPVPEPIRRVLPSKRPPGVRP